MGTPKHQKNSNGSDALLEKNMRVLKAELEKRKASLADAPNGERKYDPAYVFNNPVESGLIKMDEVDKLIEENPPWLQALANLKMP